MSSLPPHLYLDRGTLYWVGRTAITHVRPRWYSRGAPYLFSGPRIIIIQKRPNRTTVSGTENHKTHSISFGPVPDVKQRTTAARDNRSFLPAVGTPLPKSLPPPPETATLNVPKPNWWITAAALPTHHPSPDFIILLYYRRQHRGWRDELIDRAVQKSSRTSPTDLCNNIIRVNYWNIISAWNLGRRTALMSFYYYYYYHNFIIWKSLGVGSAARAECEHVVYPRAADNTRALIVTWRSSKTDHRVKLFTR